MREGFVSWFHRNPQEQNTPPAEMLRKASTNVDQEPAPEETADDTAQTMTRLGKSRNIEAAVALGAALSLSACKHIDTPSPDQIEQTKSIRHDRRLPKTFFDGNPDYFKSICVDGEFSPKERARRTKTIAEGVTIFEDVGLSFYQVRPGDTIYHIRTTLADIPKFKHLKDQKQKLESFNVPPQELKAGILLPIPMENEKRHVTDQQFARYAVQAIEEMKRHPIYGEYTNQILEHISEKELVATLVAVAKQESGGQPIGKYELHRWEPAYRVFSYSVFHVLMKDAGLKARTMLNLSEGQLYHPVNGVKLFIAYMKEKGADPENYFPISEHSEEFASFYNGRSWKKVNPKYVDNITAYHEKALTMLDAFGEDGRDFSSLLAKAD